MPGHCGTVILNFLTAVVQLCGAHFSFGCDRIITGSIDGSIRQWEVRTGTCMHTLTPHSDEVLDLCYNASGSKIATASADGTAAVHCATSGKLQQQLLRHDGEISRVRASLETWAAKK